MRDRDFEALQGKVQRLEKLRRALKVERNELSKTVQSLGGPDEDTPPAHADTPSPPPMDLHDQSCGGDAHIAAPHHDSACSHTCHCGPEVDTKSLPEEEEEEAPPLSLAAQE